MAITLFHRRVRSWGEGRGRGRGRDREGGESRIDASVMMWNIPSESKQEMERRNGKKKRSVMETNENESEEEEWSWMQLDWIRRLQSVDGRLSPRCTNSTPVDKLSYAYQQSERFQSPSAIDIHLLCILLILLILQLISIPVLFERWNDKTLKRTQWRWMDRPGHPRVLNWSTINQLLSPLSTRSPIHYSQSNSPSIISTAIDLHII